MFGAAGREQWWGWRRGEARVEMVEVEMVEAVEGGSLVEVSPMEERGLDPC